MSDHEPSAPVGHAGPAEPSGAPGLPRRDFLRRTALLGATAAFAPSLLAACSNSSRGKGEIKVAVYSPYTPPNIDIASFAKDYEAKNNGVKISISVIPDSLTGDLNSFVQKFTLEARQKTASYDLIFGPTPWVEVAPLARAHALEPLDSYIPADLKGDMPSAVKSGSTYQDGKMYDLPVWTDVVGFIYRTDLLKQALGSDQPPGTWQDVIGMATELKSKLPGGVYAYGADWTFIHELFFPILVTMTDQPFTNKGLANLDDPGALESLQIIQQLHPFMPPNSATAQLASSGDFQAKKLAMESYWQAQLQRALTAGVPQNEMAMAGNPKGHRESTVFWNTTVVMQAYSPNKDEAMKFWIDGLLKNPKFQQAAVNSAGKILPYNSMLKSVAMPDYMKPLAQQITIGNAIPMNSAFEQVEFPQFTTEVEKMVLKGQSPQDTLSNLKAAFAKYQGG